MILIKYIVKEICKNQLIVLTILFLVCFCQKFLKMLNLAIDENIPICLIFLCIGLNIPELGKLIIPFSLFISIPITFYRLHIYNEIIAMYACSVNKYIFIQSVLFFSGIVLIFFGINMLWLAPYCGCYQNKLLSEIYKSVDLTVLTEKKIQLLTNQHLVFYVDNIQERELKNIFLVRKDHNLLTIVIADQGDIYHIFNGLKLITLKKGICYEIYDKQKLYKDICVSKFYKYQVCFDQNVKILHKKNEINYMSMYQLWSSISYEALMEFHWRLTLLVSIIIMPIISTLLFIVVSPNYLSFTIFIFVLHMIFFLLHILLRFYRFLDTDNSVMFIWGINVIYFFIAWFLYFWNSVYIRKLFFIIKYFNFIKV